MVHYINLQLTSVVFPRIYEEEDIYAAIDARTDSLQSLRELGPPDLIYLVKQPKANANRQVRIDIPPDSVQRLLRTTQLTILDKHRLAFIIMLSEQMHLPPLVWLPM